MCYKIIWSNERKNKNLKDSVKFIEDKLFIKQYYHTVWTVEKIQKVKIQML